MSCLPESNTHIRNNPINATLLSLSNPQSNPERDPENLMGTLCIAPPSLARVGPHAVRFTCYDHLGISIGYCISIAGCCLLYGLRVYGFHIKC